MIEQEKYCYGCKYITSMFLGDGSREYGCSLSPGLVTGNKGLCEDDDPKACDRYEKLDNKTNKS